MSRGRTYLNAQRELVALFLLLAIAGCSNEPQLERASRPSWPLANGSTMPANIKVESATIFYCNGVRCQLLGVTEPDDPKLRKQALDFSRRWFDEIGNYIGVYNDSNPLQNEDGTCVVWIRGYDTFLSCLSVELVRAGLANVDYSSLTGYNFMVPGKENDYQETWREKLDDAAQDYKKGVKPKVLFDWPPKQDGGEAGKEEFRGSSRGSSGGSSGDTIPNSRLFCRGLAWFWLRAGFLTFQNTTNLAFQTVHKFRTA